MVNFFELLGLPTNFSLDETVLQENYRQLQRRFHPDTNPDSNAKQDIEIQSLHASMANLNAEQRSAVINEAYNTLRNVDSRAKHLLALINVEQPITDSIKDLAFLEQAMEYRIQLDDCQHNQQLDELQSAVTSWINQLANEFERLYAVILQQSINDSNMTAVNHKLAEENFQSTALQVLQKLQFLVKLSQDIDKQQDEVSHQTLQSDDDLYV